MTLRKILILGALGFVDFVRRVGSAEAAWVMIDGFDGLDLGPIGGQNQWRAPDAGSTVALDPDNLENQVLSVITASTILTHPMFVPDNETRTVFLRFRYEDQLSVSFGLSDYLYPTQFGDFEVELNLTSTRNDLRINEGGNYSELTTLETEKWFNCWLYHRQRNRPVLDVDP